MRASNRADSFVRVTLWNLLGVVVLNLILLVPLHMGVRGMLISSAIAAACLAAYMGRYVLANSRIHLDWKVLQKILSYSLPLGYSGLAVFLIHYGDRFFLRAYVSLAAIGVYSLAYKLGFLISAVHQPFHLHWSSQVSAILKRSGGEILFGRTTTHLTAVLATVVVLISLFINPLLAVMAGPGFSEAAGLVPG